MNETAYSYNKLVGRIVERFSTLGQFAESLGVSQATLSYKLNNRSEWTQDEILESMRLLEIPKSKICEYFFDTDFKIS